MSEHNLHDIVMHIVCVKPIFLKQVLSILSNLVPGASAHQAGQVLEYLMNILSRVANQDFTSKIRIMETTLLWLQRCSSDLQVLTDNIELITETLTECNSAEHLSHLLEIFVKMVSVAPKLTRALI